MRQRQGSRGDAAVPLRAVTYIIGTYPLLTTTFIDREVDELRREGVDVEVVSLRRPSGPLSPGQREVIGDVRYLLPVSVGGLLGSHLWFLTRRPARFLSTLLYLLTRPHPRLRDRARTLMHFGEGVCVARLLHREDRLVHLHAHFVDRAATVALVAGRLLDTTYSATAHANDIYVSPLLLAEKMQQASFIATCTTYNASHLAAVAGGDSGKIVCCHHGLDLERYEPSGPDARDPGLVLSVGQLKPKKGFSDLLSACALLRDRGYRFRCEIVGDGPLRETLTAAIRSLELEELVTLRGSLAHDDVVELYRRAAVFALPCVEDEEGGRDGIPNVILEAMAMEVPVVSTRHSGIPEAVSDGVSGLLVPPGRAEDLAAAVGSLLDAPDVRARMGRSGRQTVAEKFDVTVNVKGLLACFDEAVT